MSIYYTGCVIGEESLLSESSLQLVCLLDEIGFSFVGNLGVIQYDNNMECFIDFEKLKYSPMRLMTSTKGINNYNGVSISCSNSEVTLDFRLVNHNSYSYCFLDILDRHLYQLFQNKNITLLRKILTINIKSVNTIAGFGAMELEWEPYSLDEIVSFIVNGPPLYEGKPPPVGIISTHALSFSNIESKLEAIYDHAFSVEDKKLLLRKGVVKQFSSLSK